MHRAVPEADEYLGADAFSRRVHSANCGVSIPTAPRAPSIQTIPTLGAKIYRYDLLWAIWSPREQTQESWNMDLGRLHAGCPSLLGFGDRR